jgi:phosphoenolpyruvate carboxykinase (GTP)
MAFSKIFSRNASSVPVSVSDKALEEWTNNDPLRNWISKHITHMKPDRVHFVDGTDEEASDMISGMVDRGTLIQLDPEKRPNSYLARSDVADVARVEETTFICSQNERDAGPTNNWHEPDAMREKMWELYDGCMEGRTMYVIPFSMGPLGSSLSSYGVQLTDSPYVTQSMKIMTRIGDKARDCIGKDGDFVPAVHSLGAPLKAGQEDSPWPCNPSTKLITHFPETRDIMSFGSGYGGNALLGKKCFALRIASCMGRDEGWMAEHMLILGVTNPEGEKKYVAAAFPSACGKTNFAMLEATIPGWKVECVGDDIAWMRIGADGRLRAINPENGFFGVAPGTGYDTNPMAMEACAKNTIFTNVALTPDGDVWWPGISNEIPDTMNDWVRREWFKDTHDKKSTAHPNSRFCCPASQCPIIDEKWEDPEGVPIDAIIFGGRRADTVPLVYQSRSWEHGTYLGAMMNSEMTAAAAGTIGALRNDPFAMKPFCGYNMADYMQHWLDMGERGGEKMPKIFYVNWFRKDEEGGFIWPGFGENSRVLKWIFGRCDETVGAQETPIGLVPDLQRGDLDLDGLDISDEAMQELFDMDLPLWRKDTENNENNLKIYGNDLPEGIQKEHRELKNRLDME